MRKRYRFTHLQVRRRLAAGFPPGELQFGLKLCDCLSPWVRPFEALAAFVKASVPLTAVLLDGFATQEKYEIVQ